MNPSFHVSEGQTQVLYISISTYFNAQFYISRLNATVRAQKCIYETFGSKNLPSGECQLTVYSKSV